MKKYIVSKQGNRNLVLDQGVATFVHKDLTEARAEANRRTIDSGDPWFVFEIEPKLLFSYRPIAQEVEHGSAQ